MLAHNPRTYRQSTHWAAAGLTGGRVGHKRLDGEDVHLCRLGVLARHDVDIGQRHRLRYLPVQTGKTFCSDVRDIDEHVADLPVRVGLYNVLFASAGAEIIDIRLDRRKVNKLGAALMTGMSKRLPTSCE